MININTMNELEKLHIGSDVDKLENYLALINYSELMGNCIVTEEDKEKIQELLEEIKPNSELFKYTWDMKKVDIDEFDALYTRYGKFLNGEKSVKLREITESEITPFTNNIIGTRDILAIAIPDGIDIRIIYRNGLYYKAFTYYKDTKGIDITQHIKYLVPYNIQEITDTGLIELQARISMTTTSMKEAGIKEEDKMYFIANYISHEFLPEDTNKFCVKVYKMYCEDVEAIMNTLWNEYELLDETELDIAEHAIIRDIEGRDVIDAIYEIQNYFDSFNEADYLYTDFIICINTDPENTKLVLNKKKVKKQVYETTVQDIKWIPSSFTQKPRLEIKPVTLKDGETLRHIDLDDLHMIHRLTITKGSKIKFILDYKHNIKII